MASGFANQIENRNFLSPIGFKFSIAKIPKVAFFSNSAKLPEIEAPTAKQATYTKHRPVPGDVLIYDIFKLRFLVDENLENYMSVHNWLIGLGFPDSPQQFKDLTTDEDGIRDLEQQFSDGSLYILNSNYRTQAIVKFRNLFPVNLTTLEFTATDTDINYLTAEVTFEYDIYDILASDGRTPL